MDDPLTSPIQGITLKFVKLANGMTMRVACCGPEDGIPVVFMHGWPESWFSWRHQIKYFGEQGYNVMAPDMRGYGYSSCPPNVDDYDVYSHASDIICLLQAHGLTKAILVGHDWGAILGWLFAHLYPEVFPVVANLSVPTVMRKSTDLSPYDLFKKRFKIGQGPDKELFFYITYHNERYDLENVPNFGPAEAEYDSNLYEYIYRTWSDETVKRDTNYLKNPLRVAGGRLWRTPRPLHLPKWLSQADLDYVVKQFQHSGSRGGVNYYRNFHRNFVITPQLIGKTIDQPTFFLTGANDGVRGMLSPASKVTGDYKDDKQYQGLMTVCTDLRQFHIIQAPKGESCSHWIQQDQPKQVNERLHSFFKETEDVFKSAKGGLASSSKM